MVYLNNVPQAADSPATQSQADLLENFAQLETQFSGDHVSLMALANNGMHTQIRFEDVAVPPALATPMASLYTGADANLSSQLFFQNFDVPSALNVVRQMTNLIIANVANPGTAGGTLYQIDFPIGVTVYAGQTLAGGTVTFPTAYTAIYAATVTQNVAGSSSAAVLQAVGGLTISGANPTNWIAIGTL